MDASQELFIFNPPYVAYTPQYVVYTPSHIVYTPTYLYTPPFSTYGYDVHPQLYPCEPPPPPQPDYTGARQEHSRNEVGNSSERRKRWECKSGKSEQHLPLDPETTCSVMIKNIPNRYTRTLLIGMLDAHCKIENEKLNSFVSAYDFVYLPIDFEHGRNIGYAFVNFTTPKAALGFRDAFEGKNWNLFKSLKKIEISAARIQGKEALINHCKKIDFTKASEDDMPVWFEPARNGAGRVKSEMIPVGKLPC